MKITGTPKVESKSL